MKYAFRIGPTHIDEHLFWAAESTVLKGCSAQGETLADTIAQLEQNEQAWLTAALQHGIPIPQAQSMPASFDGRLAVRLSKSLHKDLVMRAAEDHVSINQFVSDAVAQRIGYLDGLRQAERKEAMPPSV